MIVFAFLIKLLVATAGCYLFIVVSLAYMTRHWHRGCCQRDPWGADTWGWPLTLYRVLRGTDDDR